ncbi:MAG: hypothetical protein LCI00_11620 [Chloroflexi bacterium]|nr:hypothetical protein [Chloroflexota bacterium]MCC6896343.1 hypothetical protein [Anaerolineae bacterium]
MKNATQLNPKGIVRNPEEEMLIDAATLLNEDRAPFYHQALAGLGRQLTDWGERLQERYDTATQMPIDMTAIKNVSK